MRTLIGPKLILCLLNIAAGYCLVAVPTFAGGRPAAQIPFAVTEIGLKSEQFHYVGVCTKRVRMVGWIKANGPGTVTYAIVGTENSVVQVQTLEFKEAGTKEVSAEWGIQQSVDGWAALRVLSPMPMEKRLPLGSFRVSCQLHVRLFFLSYTVNHQTNDDILERDGAGDEVFSWNRSFTFDTSGDLVARSEKTSERMGDINAGNAIKAGYATAHGGLSTGSTFAGPNPPAPLDPFRDALAASPGAIPGPVFDGILTQDETAAAVFVNLWEWDNDDSPLTEAYRTMLPGRNLGASLLPFIRSRAPEPVARTQHELDVNRIVTLDVGPLGNGVVNTRPIGMTKDPLVDDVFVFDGKAIILTYDNAIEASNRHQVLELHFVDDTKLGGDYTLYFRVTTN